MLFEFSCSQCMAEALERGASREEIEGAARASATIGLITHESAATITCPRGHRTSYLFQGGAHALFYERALQRLAQGSTRDAVLDAYTALEIHLKIVVERCAFEAGGPSADLSAIRKRLKDALRTSERAMGAAIAAITIRTGQAPPPIPSWLPQLRNDATHNGAYSSGDDAEKAVLEVARVVRQFERQLDDSAGADPRRYEIVAFAQAHAAQMKKEPGAARSTVGMPLVLGNVAQPPVDPSARLEDYRRGIGLFFG